MPLTERWEERLIYFLKIFVNPSIKINDLKYQILVGEIQTYLVAVLR